MFFLKLLYLIQISITKTGRKLNLKSDARYRFERGVDSESIYWGVDIASQFIMEICNGESSEIVTTSVYKTKQKIINFNSEKIKLFGGINIPVDDQIRILNDLGFTTKKINNIIIEVRVPTFRPDIDGEADLVEEILRIYGFENIPVEED